MRPAPQWNGALRNRCKSTRLVHWKQKHKQCDRTVVHASQHELNAVSPLDGRYAARVRDLSKHFSEKALMEQRVSVEAKWALHLIDEGCACALGMKSPECVNALQQLTNGLLDEDVEQIKQSEALLNHDVKAVEYFVKERVKHAADVQDDGVLEAVHFGCTSEDINNLAHAIAVKRSLEQVMLPEMDRLIDSIASLAESLADVPILSRTHGQAASPTTLGRELAVFALRLKRQRECVASVHMQGKMAGAVGNYSAHKVAEPGINWAALSERFVNSLGLELNPLVTQIEPHDAHAEVFDALERFNAILLDFAKDVWGYISLGYFKQALSEDEVGSSTMPHKVNPIDFENCEGNLGIANAIMDHLGSKLQVSRFQRDLSDSTAIRNVGVGFSHTLLALRSATRGVSKLEVNEDTTRTDLSDHWELLGEAVQTVLRRAQVSEPYERIKKATRGQTLNREQYLHMLEQLPLSDEDRASLRDLSPESYIGYSAEQARSVRAYMREVELSYAT